MSLPSFQNSGTASVDNGGTTVTGQSTAWLNTVYPGDLFGTHVGRQTRIASVDSDTQLTLAYAWAGPDQTASAYEIQIVPDAARFQETERGLLQLLRQRLFLDLSSVAKGTLDNRDNYDARSAGFAYLRTDVDPYVVYFKNSDTSADWNDGADFVGADGAQGAAGLIGTWQGAWATGTDYVVNDAVYEDGSSYICDTAHTSSTFATDLAAGKWELVAEGGADGVDGISFSPQGSYDDGTAYAANAVVDDSGSSWIALQATTGNAPPTLPTTSNAYWTLNAGKGTDGAGTGDVVGPSGATAGNLAAFDGATGKLLKDGGKAVSDFATAAQGTTANAALPRSGGTMTGALTLSGAPTVDLHAATKKYVDDNAGGTDPWAMQPIGVLIPVSDDLTGVVIPPIDNADYRYIKLTAGEDGSGEYNEGVLTSESVSGSAPLVVATAVIDMASSPIDGQTIHLINTERRFLRAGSAGTVEADAFQGHHHGVFGAFQNFTSGGANGYRQDGTPTEILNGNGSDIVRDPKTDGSNGAPRTDDETRVKNLGVTYYMRIL